MDKSFTGNDLKRLGNIEKLPTQPEIEAFIKGNPSKSYKNLATSLLKRGQMKEAWMALLYAMGK